MAAEVRPPPAYFPIQPPVKLNRCPICYTERVPILADREDQEFLARCPSCGFEGKFPAGSRSASSVRRWTAAELRRMRRRAGPFPDPEPRLTAAELAAELGNPREEG